MYRLVSKLLYYKNLAPEENILGKNGATYEKSILIALADIMKSLDEHEAEVKSNLRMKETYVEQVYEQVHRILELATDYGFNENLWQNYLAFLLVTNENPFSLICEKVGARDGSANLLAISDIQIFRQLFTYDFSRLEELLEINCFSVITNYKAIEKSTKRYNKNVSDKVIELSRNIANARDEQEMFDLVTAFYKAFGVGTLGLNKAFRVVHEENGPKLIPITNTQEVRLEDLIGYEIQKEKLVDNTKAFVDGKKANNALLFGDAGTGKSTSVKAILNEYYNDGLRMIEIYKHQFQDLSAVISQLKNRNYKFIIFMDDLSFEEFEIEYKYLKAVIEGGLEVKPDNVLIYATSNRRHLIRETWNDRSDMENNGEMHRSDTMSEKLSLVSRFGTLINYSAPVKKEYDSIVIGLARRNEKITLTDDELIAEARKWELSHGGMSGRTAQQLINYIAAKFD